MNYPKLQWLPPKRLGRYTATFPTHLYEKIQTGRYFSSVLSWGGATANHWLNTAPTIDTPTRYDVFEMLCDEAVLQGGALTPRTERALMKASKRALKRWDPRVAVRFLTMPMKYTEEDFESVSHYGAKLAAQALGCSPTTIRNYRKAKSTGITVYERLRRLASYAKSLVKRELTQPFIITREAGAPLWKRERQLGRKARFYQEEPMQFTESKPGPVTMPQLSHLLDPVLPVRLTLSEMKVLQHA